MARERRSPGAERPRTVHGSPPGRNDHENSSAREAGSRSGAKRRSAKPLDVQTTEAFETTRPASTIGLSDLTVKPSRGRGTGTSPKLDRRVTPRLADARTLV